MPAPEAVAERFQLARQPALILVDELAHTNAPGSPHAKRWEDVEDLLAAGIDVISTVNVQHLESLNDVVEAITQRGGDEHRDDGHGAEDHADTPCAVPEAGGDHGAVGGAADLRRAAGLAHRPTGASSSVLSRSRQRAAGRRKYTSASWPRK